MGVFFPIAAPRTFRVVDRGGCGVVLRRPAEAKAGVAAGVTAQIVPRWLRNESVCQSAVTFFSEEAPCDSRQTDVPL
jgi:hypothetical protein